MPRVKSLTTLQRQHLRAKLFGGGFTRNQQDVDLLSTQTREMTSKFMILDKLNTQRLHNTYGDGKLGQQSAQNTMEGLKAAPFRQKYGQLEIARSQSTLDIIRKRSNNDFGNNTVRFKNYLPNIICTTSTDLKLQESEKRLKIVMKKPDEPATFRQDVSYLKDLGQNTTTPTQQPNIITTGDRGQDKLLEATIGIKRLGKSLINLPLNLEELSQILFSYQDQEGLTLLQEPDEEEKILERYLEETFSPLEELIQLQQLGKLNTQSLTDIKLQTPTLRYHLDKHISPKQKSKLLSRLSPKRSTINKKDQLQSVQLQNTNIEQSKETLHLLNKKLFKKYSEKSFFNKPKACSFTYQDFTEQITANLDLGNPSSRQDAVIVTHWFEKMLKQLVQSRQTLCQSEDAVYSQMQLVMNICINELVRQVSVHCIERGRLIKRVFASYVKFMKLMNIDNNQKRKKLKLDYALKLDRYCTVLEHQAQGYREQISELESNNRLQKTELEELYKQLKEQNVMMQRFKKKCFTQQRDIEGNQSKLRFLEKENKQLKLKLRELKDDFNLDVSELDENDKLRLMLEVEREIQDLEKEKQLNSRFNQTRTSLTDGKDGEDYLQQISDRDVIAQDDREISTQDFDAYLRSAYGILKWRDKDIQTEPGEHQCTVYNQVDPYELDIMFNVGIDTLDLNPKLNIRFQDNYEELGPLSDDDDDDQDYESNADDQPEYDEDLKDFVQLTIDERLLQDGKLNRLVNSAGTSPLKGRMSVTIPNTTNSNNPSLIGELANQIFSPASATLKLLEYLAMTLVQRANQLLERERARIEKVAQACPPNIANSLRAGLKETIQDIEQLKKEFLKKKTKVKRSVKQSKKQEITLRRANEKIDNFELDNYNMREQLQEQLKLFDDYKALLAEMQSLIEQQLEKPNLAASLRIREIVIQLNELLASNQSKALQVHLNTLQSGTDQDADFPKDLQLPSLDGTDGQTINIQIGTNPHSHTTPNALDRSSSKNISNQEFTRRRGVKFQHHLIGKKRISQSKAKGTHPAYAILKRIQTKDPKKLTDIMPRKMLLRVIYSVYQEKGEFDLNLVQQSEGQQLNMNQTSSTQLPQNQQQNSLIEWIYDSFMQKYGLKNVAERKFNQLISSCITYKDQLARIGLFGRFLEAYDDLPISDYNRYLKINSHFSQSILNFKVDENLECTLLPLSRAIDFFKFKFESKMVQYVFNQRIHMIERKKIQVTLEDLKVQKHLKGVRDAIDFDWFAQFVIDNYIFIQDDKEQQIKDLFMAMDVTSSGFINLKSFETLMKLFHYKSLKYTKRLFDEYATLKDSALDTVKLLSCEQFMTLALERDIFTPKIQAPLINSKHPEKDFQRLSHQLPSIISLFRARLVSIELINDPYTLELLDNLQTAVKYPISSRVAWVCYRITDEVIKRLYLKKTSESYIPVDMNTITEIKVKPSQQLVNNININCFDTQH